tara:strand:- start:3472 stop:4086 length:615 start_codon:yes stop_codon:yes gene_type:complete
MTDRETHWNEVYGAREETALTWFEDTPAVSMTLLRRAGLTRQSRVVDVGGGASRLVDALLADGVRDVTVLDLSAAALAVARGRLGARADAVNWVVGDVTKWDPSQPMDLWHDRAVFHFLTEEADRAAYVRTMMRALPAGATAVIGTFALDGPERCSNLPVQRYDAASLARALGDGFERIDSHAHIHRTPMGRSQSFVFGLFKRL